MSKTADYIGQAAADSTNALNPLLGGLNRQELLGSVAMMLRRTSISPMANAKFAGKMAKESYDIIAGNSINVFNVSDASHLSDIVEEIVPVTCNGE